ncbi:hypothetical protein QVD17_21280 [Tagetes erecta]|uniref:Remorin C-terminal domain-containing protein n=1 Tax=Tagetes erecta TaxID=13708 RepID=A0AAD8KN31_TARER|nr:hypothetical protein QVD17_21280 [Tagetes erecta]
MKSIEVDKGCFNLGSPQPHDQIIRKAAAGGGNRLRSTTAALGKPNVPSKWDDAQKWLVRGRDNTSTHSPRDSNAAADDTTPLPHPTTQDDDIHLETKKVVVADFGHSVCVRDMGTDMTPMPSQEPSRSATPTTPMASASPTLDACTGTTSVQQPNHVQVETPPPHSNLNPLETRALAWDEAERAKYMARFKREEVKIEAWENHEKRKAEMEMKRMEGKAERMKSRAQEKYANKVASTRRIAEERRAKAEAILNEKAVKTSERADYIRRTGHMPSFFSLNLPSSSCW